MRPLRTCARPGCDNVFPANRHKAYCSEFCRHKAYKEKMKTPSTAARRRYQERGRAVRHGGIDVGLGRQQQRDDFDVALLRRHEERGLAVRLGGIDVGIGRQEKTDDIAATARRRLREGGLAELVPDIDIRAGVDDCADSSGVAGVHRLEQLAGYVR